MVTLTEARAQVQQTRKQFEQKRQQVQKAKPKELTTRQVRSQTATDVAKRKAERMGFTSRRQEALKQLGSFETQLKEQESIVSQAEQQQRTSIAQAGKLERDIAIAKKAVTSGRFIGLSKDQKAIASNLREAQTNLENLKEKSIVIKEELDISNVQFKELGAEKLQAISLPVLQRLEKAGAVELETTEFMSKDSTTEIPDALSFLEQRMSIQPEIKKPTIKQAVVSALFGQAGAERLGFNVLPTVPTKQNLFGFLSKPDVTFQDISTVISSKGGLPGKVASQFIPTTPGEAATFAGVGLLASSTKVTGKVTRGILFGTGVGTAVSSDTPIETRIAGGLVAGAIVLPSVTSFFFKPIKQTVPLREVKTPSFFEFQRTGIKDGKQIRFSEFLIEAETRPPTAEFFTTRFRQVFSQPKSVKIKPSKFQIIKTLEPAVNELPFLVGKRTGKGKVITEFVLSGKSMPRSINEFKKLPNVEKFLWKRMAEQVTGRPVSFENVPKVLAKNTKLVRSFIESQKVAKVKLQKSGINLEIIPSGKTITRSEALTKIKTIKETDKLKISESITLFKDVTLPGARAIGKTPKLKGKIIEIKEPKNLDTDTGVQILQPAQIPKTPLQKTFQQLTTQSQTVKAISTLPKTTTPKPTTKVLETKVDNLIGIPRSVGGSGLTDLQLAQARGKPIPIEEMEIIETGTTTFNPIISQTRIDTITIGDVKVKVKPSVATFQQPQLKVLQQELLSTKNITKLSPKSKILLKTGLETIITSKEITKLIQKPLTKQIEIQKVITKVKPKLKTTTTFVSKTPTPKPTKIIIPPGVSETATLKKLVALRKKQQGVDVVVGLKLKKRKIIARNVHPFTGLKKGLKFIDKNIQASVKLVPSGKKAKGKKTKPFNVGKKFRPSKTNPIFLVEKRKFRLDDRNEKRQIKKTKKGKKFKRRLLGFK